MERLQQYMTKALSEAKINLSWMNPNEKYVEAVHGISRGDSDAGCAKAREREFVAALQLLLPALQDVRGGEFAGAGGAEDRVAGGSGFLPGNGDVGPEPGGPGQSAAGGLRDPAARLWDG